MGVHEGKVQANMRWLRTFERRLHVTMGKDSGIIWHFNFFHVQFFVCLHILIAAAGVLDNHLPELVR
jgi:hypothetical protein